MINVWVASDSTHEPVRNSMAPSAARPTSNRRVSEHSPSDERVTLDEAAYKDALDKIHSDMARYATQPTRAYGRPSKSNVQWDGQDRTQYKLAR